MITPPNHPHEMLLKVYTTCTCASQLGITLCMTVYCYTLCIKVSIHAIMPHETLLKIHALLVQTCDITVQSAPEISHTNQ